MSGIPLLVPVSDDSPGVGLPSSQEIVRAARQASEAGEPQGLISALSAFGVPVEDMFHTVFSAQIAAMGLADGRGYYHHELRGYFPLPESLQPEVSVWSEDSLVPVWQNGVLQSPKYFSFGVETSLVPYHPNFRRKWRVHELMHTLCQFFWHPQMSRFALYLGARLSELGPIVHWYGLDEIFRTRCPKHQGKLLYREYCSTCEASYVPYWQQKEFNEQHALGHAQHALEHYQSELKACQQELESGQRVATPRPNLDASGDALGYVKGHWNRLTAWSFGGFIENFMVADVDYCTTIGGLISRVDGVMRAVLRGGQQLEPEMIQRNQLRRILQDVGYRGFLALEWSDDDELEQSVFPRLEACASYCHELLERHVDPESIEQAIDELWSAFSLYADRLPEEVVTALPELGYIGRMRPPSAGYSIRQGLQSALPESLSQVLGWQDKINDFVASDIFLQRGELAGRFCRWVKQHVAPLEYEVIRLESWFRAKPHRDEEGEYFASMPPSDGWGEGHLRCNETLRIARFEGPAIAGFFGWELDEPDKQLTLCCSWVNGQPQIIPCTDEVEHLLQQVKDGERPELNALVLELLELGVLIWLPQVH